MFHISPIQLFLYSYIHVSSLPFSLPKNRMKRLPPGETPRIGKLLTKHVWIKAVVPIHVACRIAWSAASCWRRTRKNRGCPLGG